MNLVDGARMPVPGGVDAAATGSAFGLHTGREIRDQAISWRSALEVVTPVAEEIGALVRRNGARPLLFLGCGSPYHLCQAASAIHWSAVGATSFAVAAGEIMLDPAESAPPMAMSSAVAVSRSGETSELLAAVRWIRAGGGEVIAITPTDQSSLVDAANVTIVLRDADEVSLAQTRSFGAMLIATLDLIASLTAADALHEGLRRVVAASTAITEQAEAVTDRLLTTAFDRIIYLGSGARLGIAREAAIKAIEMSLTDASAYPILEFRHGPQALIDERSLVVGLLSPDARTAEWSVLDEMHELGATVVAAGARGTAQTSERFVSVPPIVEELSGAHLVEFLPLIQLIAYKQASKKGVDPDVPRNLSRYVDLSEFG